MQDLRILIGGVVMLFVSAFLMAEHSQAAIEHIPILKPTIDQAQNVTQYVAG